MTIIKHTIVTDAILSEAVKAAGKLSKEIFNDMLVYGKSVTITFTCPCCQEEVVEIVSNKIVCPKCKMTYTI